MADDGMLLNFELPPDAFALKKTFKGGSWKDRLTAKKSAEYGQKKAQERADLNRNRIPNFQNSGYGDEELVLPNDRPTKRARTYEGGEATSVRALNEKHAQPQRHTAGLKPLKDGVVSSLFTYNPKSTVAEPQSAVEDDQAVQPSNAPVDDELANFTSLGLSTPLAAHLLKKLGVQAPTEIQQKAIQQLCSSHTDAFIQAQTGSGKTLAYLLPIVERLMSVSRQMKAYGQDFDRHSGLLAIILSPTRELSRQISTVLENLLTCCNWIVSGTVLGGEKKKSEKARLRKGLNILVATPGRLADHLDSTEVLDVSRVRWLVLDEGDRLMELGFENDIKKIVSVMNLRSRKIQDVPLPGLPEHRSTILCSATLKSGADQLKNTTLKEAVAISTDTRDENAQTTTTEVSFSAPAQLKQSYVIAPAKQRLVTLVATLKQTFRRKGSVMKCITFISCADSVDFHFELFARGGSADGKADTESEEKAKKPAQRPEAGTGRQPNRILQGTSIPETRTYGPATVLSSKDNQVQVFRLHGSLPQAVRTATLAAFTKCADPAVLVCTDVASRGLDLPNVDLVIEYDPPFSKDEHLHRIGRTARAGKEGRAMIFLMPGCEEGYVDILKQGGSLHPTRHEADDMLKKGFSPSSGVVVGTAWQDAATDWQLDAERWALEHPKHLEQARRAFQSHVRAYATHVAIERRIFDMQQLHLGHLAKAFALRDKPGSMRVPGLRPGKAEHQRSNDARKTSAGKAAGGSNKRGLQDSSVDTGSAVDEREARNRMHAKMRAMGGASEFNLG